MNKYLLLLCTAAMLSLTVATAQITTAPQSLTYQAVARDASGNLLVNKSIGLRMTIVENAAAVYTETFTANTNAYGMFTVTLGKGTVVTGNFSAINWTGGGTDSKSLKVELDPVGGTAYVNMGSTTFTSVPYALVADKASNMTLDNLTDVNAASPSTNQVLQWNGTTWVAANGGSTVQTNSTLSGDGSSGSPLKLADQSATSGQVLQWNGITWSPATIAGGVGDNWGTQFVQKNVTLDGNGTNALPLKIAQQGAVTGDALRWNGTTWAPSAPFSLPYSGSGVGGAGLSTFRIINPSASGPSQGAMYAESNGGIALEAASDPASGIAVSGASQSGIGIYGKSSTGLAGQFDGTVAVLGQLKVFGYSVTKASDYYLFDQTSNLSAAAGTTTAVTGLNAVSFTVDNGIVASPAKVIFTFNSPTISTTSNASGGEDFQFQLVIKQGATIVKQVTCTDNIKGLGTRSFSYTMHSSHTAGSYTASVFIVRGSGLGTVTVGASQVQIQVVNQ